MRQNNRKIYRTPYLPKKICKNYMPSFGLTPPSIGNIQTFNTLGDPCQNTKLAPCTPCNHSNTLRRSIDNFRRDSNVARRVGFGMRTVADLPDFTKSPTPCTSILGNCNIVMTPTEDFAHGWDVGNNTWIRGESGFSTAIDNRAFRGRGGGEAKLIAIHPAKGKDLAFCRQGEGMVFSPCNFDNVVIFQSLDNTWARDDSAVFSDETLPIDPALTELIEAPGVDFAVVGDSEGVVTSRTDGADTFESEFTREEVVETGSFDDTATELELLAISPGEDFALGCQSKDMVSSTDNLSDVFEVGDQSRMGGDNDCG